MPFLSPPKLFGSKLQLFSFQLIFHIITSSFVDLKLHLQSTDYGNFLQNEAGPLSVSVIDDKLRDKLVTEFRHLRNQALEPLATFMDFIT